MSRSLVSYSKTKKEIRQWVSSEYNEPDNGRSGLYLDSVLDPSRTLFIGIEDKHNGIDRSCLYNPFKSEERSIKKYRDYLNEKVDIVNNSIKSNMTQLNSFRNIQEGQRYISSLVGAETWNIHWMINKLKKSIYNIVLVCNCPKNSLFKKFTHLNDCHGETLLTWIQK